MYAQALKFVRKNFQCNPYNIQVRSDWGFEFMRVAHETHRTHSSNTETIHYETFFVTTQQIDIQETFDDVLGRDFSATLSNLFCMDSLSPEHIESLFQHLIHDGEAPAENLEDITISDVPSTFRSLSFSESHPEIASHYANPCQTFKFKEYENWTNLNNTVHLSGNLFREVKKDNKYLSDILKNENLTPALRFILKLWILHQLKSLVKKKPNTAPKCLTHKGGIITNITKLEKSIHTKLKNFATIERSDRLALLKTVSDEEKTNLSPMTFKLLQRIPLLKPFFGHVNYDIHLNTKHKQFNFSWGKDKIVSLLHVPLLKFLVNSIKNSSKTAYHTGAEYIYGKASLADVLKRCFHVLKAVFTALWFPVLVAFTILSGLSSAPFYLFRKALNIPFGSRLDKTLSYFELIKDAALLYLMGPIALTLYNTLASFALTAWPLYLGASIAFAASITVTSPLYLMMLTGTETFVYDLNNRYLYSYTDYSERDAFWNGLKSFSAIPLVAAHFLIGATALTGYLAISIGAKLGRLLLQAAGYLQPVTLEKLIVNTQNLNHNNEFRKLLGILHEKQAQQNLDNHDQAIIETLREMILSDTEKDQLKQIIEDLNLTTRNVTQKRLFALARQNIKHDTFIPSDKLTKAIRKNLETTSEQEFNALDQKLAHIEENYDVLAQKQPIHP